MDGALIERILWTFRQLDRVGRYSSSMVDSTDGPSRRPAYILLYRVHARHFAPTSLHALHRTPLILLALLLLQNDSGKIEIGKFCFVLFDPKALNETKFKNFFTT